MTLALRDLQASFAAHLDGEERPDLASAVTDSRRLAIHCHHIVRSLAAALAVTYPTVQALVGDGYFRQTAEAFVKRNLPAQPVLAEYGADFPDFLEMQKAVHGLAYLADVARLDWALNTAFYSSRGECLTASDLAGLPPEQLAARVLVLVAGTAVLQSRFPLDLIWATSQPDATEDKVDIAQGPVHLLVLARAEDAGFIRLGEGEAAFVAAVACGRSLEAAAGAGLLAESSFDPAACFARLLGSAIFAASQH